MKYLIVGLGNPGKEYEHTRHNIGFDILDNLANELNGSFKNDRLAEKCEVKYKGRLLLLIKPTTFMNLSGKAVNYWLTSAKIEIQNLLVLVDDLALPFGTLRLRPSGSDAGHNGLKHIQQTLGHVNYARLRFGIGNNYPKGYQADYVLSPFTKEEQLLLPERIKLACDVIKSFATIGIQNTMNIYNNK
jgi:PTH1 family peptidyl-tRNA hydrolase